MYRVKLIVRYLFQNTLTGLYVHSCQLPFVPTIGMKFEQGTSTRLWETEDDEELSPSIEDVIYDIDEEEIICLFTVHKRLASAFWETLDPGSQRVEFHYIRNKK